MAIADTLRMWWMLTWRTTIFGVLGTGSVNIVPSLVVISLGVALVVRIGLGINIFAFPIFKLIKRSNAWELTRKSPLRNKVKSRPLDLKPRVIPGDFNYKTFSPMMLQNVALPYSNSMYGTPGAGLSDSNFSELNISLGQKGEENFAKALGLYSDNAGKRLIDSMNTFWSVAMPSAGHPSIPDEKFETDIDCVAIAGNTVYLIDLKFYESNGAVYSSNEDTLYVHGKTSRTVKMTRNMAMAHDRFRRAFPGVNIESRVVFVPTSDKPAVLNNVKWPGHVPAVNLDEMLTELATRSAQPTTAAVRKVGSSVQTLLKG